VRPHHERASHDALFRAPPQNAPITRVVPFPHLRGKGGTKCAVCPSCGFRTLATGSPKTRHQAAPAGFAPLWGPLATSSRRPPVRPARLSRRASRGCVRAPRSLPLRGRRTCSPVLPLQWLGNDNILVTNPRQSALRLAGLDATHLTNVYSAHRTVAKTLTI